MAAVVTEERLREGIAAVQSGEKDRARELLQPVADESPDNVIAWFWLALASPSTDAAATCLRHVLQIDGGNGPARAALARLLVTEAVSAWSAGKRSEARAFAREAVELVPTAGVTWLTLGSVSNDRTERLDALRRAVQFAPRPQTRARLRQALMHQAVLAAEADRPSARALLGEAAALDPADAHVWQALARMADTSDELLEVVREMSAAARGNAVSGPIIATILGDYARAFKDAGQVAEACACWREAISVNGRDVDGWLGLAETTEDDQEKRRALQAASEIEAGGARPDAEPVIGAPAPSAAPAEAVAELAGIAPRADAFARFLSDVDLFALRDSLPDPFAGFEFLADPFARFAPEGSAGSRTWPPHSATGVVSRPLAATRREPANSAPAAATPSSSSPTASTLAGAGSRAEAAASSRRTVMVVDDSPTVRKVLGLTLERAGFRVVAEPDGESALERLTQLLPDAVLLDTGMPRLDGYAVCSRMRHDPRTARIPVVMLSDEDAVFDSARGRMSGATAHLRKPCEAPALFAVLSDAFLPA